MSKQSEITHLKILAQVVLDRLNETYHPERVKEITAKVEKMEVDELEWFLLKYR